MLRKKPSASLDASKFNYVKSEEQIPKSSDTALADYSIWRYLKQQLNKQSIETLDGLKKEIYTKGKSWIKLILKKF